MHALDGDTFITFRRPRPSFRQGAARGCQATEVVPRGGGGGR